MDLQDLDDDQLQNKMVFDDEGYPQDEDSDLCEEELIKQLVSQQRGSKTHETPVKIGNPNAGQQTTPVPQSAKSHQSVPLTSSQKPQITFLAHKAGMDGCDMEAIKKRIYELEKDTDFYKKQQFKTERAKTKGRNMVAKIERFKSKEVVYRRVKADAKQFVNDLERLRNLERTWLHIDMDMFYAAVEIRDRPELKDLPIAIGDMMMIATSNYVARKFGVRSAMPGYIGV